MSSTAIFWPVIVQALLTLGLYAPMSLKRIAAIKAGSARASDFRIVGNEPVESAAIVRAIANQYESPTLFYAVAIAAFASNQAGTVMVVLAWMYCVAKCAHIGVLITSNRLKIRRPMFMVAWVVLIVMWLWFAVSLAGLA
jgi:hypothetical protein